MDLPDCLAARERLVQAIREEFVGPAPYGGPIELAGAVELESVKDSYGPFTEAGTGEEVLAWDTPRTRYGAAVLFPINGEDQASDLQVADLDVETQAQVDEAMESSSELVGPEARKELEKIAEGGGGLSEDDDFDLSLANTRRPSSMAVSFLAKLPPKGEVVLDATGGRYRVVQVAIKGRAQKRRWFVRSPWRLTARANAVELQSKARRKVEAVELSSDNLAGIDLSFELFCRRHLDGVLMTVSLVNRTDGKGHDDTESLFQCEFKVTVVDEHGKPGHILPYPGPDFTQLDDEEQSLVLLHRNSATFAVGHGCSADWQLGSDPERADTALATHLPVTETPSVTPEARDADGREIVVRMRDLATEDDARGRKALVGLLDSYQGWLARRAAEVRRLPPTLVPVANRHLEKCAGDLERMKRGLALLSSDPVVARAFRLANQALLLQQLAAEREPRLITGRQTGVSGYQYSWPRRSFGIDSVVEGRGNWRPFQIAFLLMSLDGVANPNSAERGVVDLLWFPTGGGKTEAYLGLSAFAIFLRRLRNPLDVGVHVLMRYTLRLLTAQQFQRAASLMCAMEHLRREPQSGLGDEPFLAGIWLGRDTTPNSREGARAALRRLQKDGRADNPFLLVRCPWCAAQIGPTPKRRGIPPVAGYRIVGDRVVLTCSDKDCEFADDRGLPVRVVDTDLYEDRPSLVIGTVDKFAMLAWRPNARALFGIDSDGKRQASPPGLIIQDELHLISGPLGSMVGSYEMVIHELCSDNRGGRSIMPKMVASTATIRRYAEQVRALFARHDVSLFPSPALDASDSFFARDASSEDGTVAPGRLYVGVNATNHRSLITTQVQAMAALLQRPMLFDAATRDPWWTLMVFFNNLRELGTSLSLIQSNVPMHLRVIQNRQRIDRGNVRRLFRVQELTSRLRNDEVPQAIAALEVPTTSAQSKAVDVCLASNIIEVGIDIDRLSSMLVVGQPKTTSQYIQVTGRIGRLWRERPGLVLTLFNPNRPRDRSHFEHFKSYHQRLYAQVEPTSATPFSPPAVDRALHGAFTAYIRQTGDRKASSRPVDVPDALIEGFGRLVADRVASVDAAETENTMAVFERRKKELTGWGRLEWQGDGDAAQLSTPDSPIERAMSCYKWPTMMSMRNVDAQCETNIVPLGQPADQDPN